MYQNVVSRIESLLGLTVTEEAVPRPISSLPKQLKKPIVRTTTASSKENTNETEKNI